MDLTAAFSIFLNRHKHQASLFIWSAPVQALADADYLQIS